MRKALQIRFVFRKVFAVGFVWEGSYMCTLIIGPLCVDIGLDY